ncbi:MAG: phosphoribosylformylglycinamidine cyclo-ligase [Chloroflexota bacterium]
MKSWSYAQAGVDLGSAAEVKAIIQRLAAPTLNSNVLAGVGPFASLFRLGGYSRPVLVSSCDGVGTKLKVASLLNRYDTVGIDLVHHCVNDILCAGAEPLFFLDYIAMGKLSPERVAALIQGITAACLELGLPLIGGETAEMPGIYQEEDCDLVGFILGVMEEGRGIDGHSIVPGDILLALPSSGLHTNGFSLARKVFAVEEKPDILNREFPQLGRSLGEELLEPHRCYYPQLKPLLPYIKGIAHITGGGIGGNLSRILPDGVMARIKGGSWPVPPIFRLIQEQGAVPEAEMYRVFNMGLGMVLVCSARDKDKVHALLPEAWWVGQIEAGTKAAERVSIQGEL